MIKQINQLAKEIESLNTEEEIMALIKGASLVLNIDFNTLKKEVQNTFYENSVKKSKCATSEAVYYSRNVD